MCFSLCANEMLSTIYLESYNAGFCSPINKNDIRELIQTDDKMNVQKHEDCQWKGHEARSSRAISKLWFNLKKKSFPCSWVALPCALFLRGLFSCLPSILHTHISWFLVSTYHKIMVLCSFKNCIQRVNGTSRRTRYKLYTYTCRPTNMQPPNLSKTENKEAS